MSRIAVVLFNLGGPDSLTAVRPFLRNLFADPAIVRAPAPVRWALAELISRARERSAQANYAVMGGASPLLPETAAQAAALAGRLAAARPSDEVRVFVAMRYWTPFTAATAAEVARFEPDEVVLLPLYPQFSTTTSASSVTAWRQAYRGGGRVRGVCCYYDDAGWAEAHARLIREAWMAAGSLGNMRLLFSAHGLPEQIANGGDPYQWQVEQGCAKVAALLGEGWDWRVCYQSRVGPLKWIGPSTVEEIERAALDGVGVIVDPIAFVSEHVETLVELDRDYREVAERVGAAPYVRVPALGCAPEFIDGLASLALRSLGREGMGPGGGACRAGLAGCGRDCGAAMA
jgi:ferrochelatase